jgi:hypothetical protein
MLRLWVRSDLDGCVEYGQRGGSALLVGGRGCYRTLGFCLVLRVLPRLMFYLSLALSLFFSLGTRFMSNEIFVSSSFLL